MLGTAASLVIASTFFIAVFHRQTGYSIGRVLRESYLKPVLCSVASVVLVLAIHPAGNSSWLGLAQIGVAFGMLYVICILLSRFFDGYDWNKIENFIPIARYARRIARVA